MYFDKDVTVWVSVHRNTARVHTTVMVVSSAERLGLGIRGKR